MNNIILIVGSNIQLEIINSNRYTHRNAETGFGQGASLMGDEAEASRLRARKIRWLVYVCKQCVRTSLLSPVIIFSKIFIRAIENALY